MSSSSATSASRWSATSATRADQLPVEKRRYSAWKDGHKVALVEQTIRGGDVAGDQKPTGSCVSVSFVPGAVLGSGAAACAAYAQDPAFSSPFNVVRKPTRGVELMTRDMAPSTSPDSAELIRLLADCRDQEELVAAGAATWGTLSQHTSQLFMQESTTGVNRPTHKLMLVIARKKPDRGGRQLGCGEKDEQVGLELALIQKEKGAQAQPKLVEGFRFELKREVSPQKERSEVEVRDFQPRGVPREQVEPSEQLRDPQPRQGLLCSAASAKIDPSGSSALSRSTGNKRSRESAGLLQDAAPGGAAAASIKRAHLHVQQVETRPEAKLEQEEARSSVKLDRDTSEVHRDRASPMIELPLVATSSTSCSSDTPPAVAANPNVTSLPMPLRYHGMRNGLKLVHVGQRADGQGRLKIALPPDLTPAAAKSADLKSIKIQIATSAMLVDYFYPVQDSVGEKDHGCLAELKTLAACKSPGSGGVSDELREAILQSGSRTTSIYRPSKRQSRVLLAIYRRASCGGALRLVAFKRPSEGDRDSQKNLWLEEVNGFAFDLVEVEQPDETPEMDDAVSFYRIHHKRYYALQNGEKVADIGQRHDASRLNFVLSPLPGKEESSTFTAIQRRFSRNGALTWFWRAVVEGKSEALDRQVEEIKKLAASEEAVHLQHETAAASASSSASSRRRVFISDELRKALKDPTSQLFASSHGPTKIRTMLLVYKCRSDSEQGGEQSSGRAAGPLLGDEKLKLKVFKRQTLDGKDPLEEIDGLTLELVDCDLRPDLAAVSSKFEVHFRDDEGEKKKRAGGLRDISGGGGSRAQGDKHLRKKKAATRTPRTKGKEKVNRAAASSPSSSSSDSDHDPAENSENEGKPTKRPQVGEPAGHKDKDQGDPGSDVAQVKHLRYKGFKNGMKVLDFGQHNDRSGLHIALAADAKSRNSAEVDDAKRSVAESTGLLGPFYPVREGDALAGEDGHRSSKSLVEAVKKWAQNLTADSAELKAAVLAYPGTTRLFHPSQRTARIMVAITHHDKSTSGGQVELGSGPSSSSEAAKSSRTGVGVDEGDGSAPVGRPLRFLAFRKPKGYNKSDDATVVDDCALEEVAGFSFDLEVVDRDEVRGRGPGAGASRSMGAMPDLLPDDFFKSRSPHIRYFGFRNGEKLLDVCQKSDEGSSMTLVLSPVKGQEQSKTAVAVRQTIWNCWSLVQQSFTMKAEADQCVKDIRARAGKMAGTSELKSILLEPRTRFLICNHVGIRAAFALYRRTASTTSGQELLTLKMFKPPMKKDIERGFIEFEEFFPDSMSFTLVASDSRPDFRKNFHKELERRKAHFGSRGKQLGLRAKRSKVALSKQYAAAHLGSEKNKLRLKRQKATLLRQKAVKMTAPKKRRRGRGKDADIAEAERRRRRRGESEQTLVGGSASSSTASVHVLRSDARGRTQLLARAVDEDDDDVHMDDAASSRHAETAESRAYFERAFGEFAQLCKTAACPQPAKTFYEMLESELQSGRPRFRERVAEQIDKHRPPADKVSSANAEAFARQLFVEKRIAFGERLSPKDAVELLARLPFQPAGQARSCVTPAEGTNLRSLRPLQLGVTRSLVHKAGAAAINPKAREMPHAVLLLNHLASTVRPEEIVFHDATSPLGATPFQGKEYLRSAQHAEKVRKFFDEELRYASINLCAYKPGCACAPHADTNASRTLMAVFGKFQGGKFRIEQTFGAARMSAPKTSAAPIRDAFVQTDTTRKNYNEEPTAIGAVEYTLSPVEAEGEEHSDEFGVRWIVYDAKYRHEVTEVLSGARYSVVFVLTGGAKEYYFDKETEMTTATGMGFNKLPENLRQLKNGKQV